MSAQEAIPEEMLTKKSIICSVYVVVAGGRRDTSISQRAECHCLSRIVLAVLKLFTRGITICISRTSRL